MSEHNFGGRKQPDASKRARRAGLKYARDKVAREMADERNVYFQSLSILERIALLDRRLGANVGAIKQRARLKAQLETQAIAEENKGKAIVESKEAAKEVVPAKAPKKSSRQRLNEEAKAKRETNSK